MTDSEQTQSTDKTNDTRSATNDVFQDIDAPKAGIINQLHDLDLIRDIPVKIDVELGRTEMTIKELLAMTQGSVIELDGLAGDSMRIMVNGYPIARGEVVVTNKKYGIRITEIVTPSERVNINR